MVMERFSSVKSTGHRALRGAGRARNGRRNLVTSHMMCVFSCFDCVCVCFVAMQYHAINGHEWSLNGWRPGAG